MPETTTKKRTTKTTKSTATTKAKSVAKTLKTETPKRVCKKKTQDPVLVEKKKILFVASEARPFIATGGLADVIGSLPQALANDPTLDIRVLLPLYSQMKADLRRKLSFLGNTYVPLSWRNQYCGVFTYQADNVTYYFIDNEYYFNRPNCYGYYDDGERFAYFSRCALEVMPFIGFYPDVLHCHDWQAALAAIYLKTLYASNPDYQNIKALFTIHNIEYQGKYSCDILGDLFGLEEEHLSLLEFDGCLNLMKGAIECCEQFSTVSPTYAKEIKTAQYAHGLQDIICKNEHKLTGILNGIDVVSYNPVTDDALFANYSAENFENKAVCKAQLQQMLGLPVKDVPIIAMITRLVSHKGLALVKAVAEDILHEDVQFILLGTGDVEYEEYFKDLGRRYEGKTSINIAFNGDLSRKIYSGSDMFLMPSVSEPCGLSQMICSRYATVPIVRETGGLYDSIQPYGTGGNGFTFASCNPYDMLYVIHEALSTYRNKDAWIDLMKKAATTDFSWARSAKEYQALYERI